MSRLQVIAGSSYLAVGRKVARYLNLNLTPVHYSTFADGEKYVRVKQKVRGDDIFIIQSVSPPVNDNLMELLICIDALKRASAGRINVVAPYLGYSRQDRKVTSREPITAKLVANLITVAGANRIFSVDLHQDQIQGFYDIPVDHFVGYPIFAEYFQKKRLNGDKIVIVAADVGAIAKTRKMVTLLECSIAIIDKRRKTHNTAEVLNIIGEVKGKVAILIDDMVDTGGTTTSATKVLKNKGSKDVKICATHALLSGNAVEKLEKSSASEVIFLDSVPIPKSKISKKIKQLSMAKLLSKAVKRIHKGQSLGELFTWEDKITRF